MSLILLYVVTALLYAGLAWHFRRRLAGESPPLATAERLAVLVPLTSQACCLYIAMFGGDMLRFGFGYALSAMIWLAVLIYWVESFFYDLDGMHALLMPIAAIASILPWLFPAGHAIQSASLPWFRAHFVVAMLAYSLFTIAVLHALLMAWAERRLHGPSRAASLMRLPPLLTMERLLFQIIGGAFVLLTLTLASGFLFSETLYQKPLSFNHKTLFAVLSWGIFAALLAGRQLYGWRGRTALRWTLAGFATLLLAYVGSRFVLEVILHRGAA